MNRIKLLNFIGVILFLTFLVNTCYSKDKAEEWLERGIKATDYQEKIHCFNKALEFNPNFYEAYFNLGCAYRDIGEFGKAEKSFKRTLRETPDNVDNEVKLKIFYELGKTYVKLGKNRFAKEAFLYARDIATDVKILSVINYELGRLYLLSDEYDEAIASFNAGIKLNSPNIASFKTAVENAKRLKQLHEVYSEGLTNFQQRNYSEAAKLFSQIIKVDANFKDAADKLYQSQIHLARDNEKKVPPAEKELTTTTEGSKPKTIPITPPRQRYVEKKQERKEVPRTEKIEKIYQRGVAALKNDDWRVAISNFNKVKKLNPNYKDINSRIMESRLGMESVKEMEEVAKYYNHALNKFNNGEWLKAIIEFEKAKMLYPGYKDIELKIVEAKKHLRKEKKALKSGDSNLFSKEKNIASKEKNTWAMAGIIFSAIVLPIALVFFLSPEIRARYYLKQGKYVRAGQLYEHIISKHPEKTKVYVSLANIYLVNDRKDQMALKVYQNALKNEIDVSMKEKIVSIIAKECLNNNIVDNDSVNVLTQALQNEIKRLK